MNCIINIHKNFNEKIKLKWSCEGMNIWGDWGYFATIFDGMFIPIPKELS